MQKYFIGLSKLNYVTNTFIHTYFVCFFAFPVSLELDSASIYAAAIFALSQLELQFVFHAIHKLSFREGNGPPFPPPGSSPACTHTHTHIHTQLVTVNLELHMQVGNWSIRLCAWYKK